MRWLLPWLRGFGYAFQGLRYALATQRNFRFHVAAALVVSLLAWLCRVSSTEWWMLLGVITLVVVAELLNTAIELAVDLAMPKAHPAAKAAKDVAATAVLLAAVFAMFTGWIVFDSYILAWLSSWG